MSYVRSFRKTLKDGTVRDYFARVEGYREGGKVRQRVIEYLGTNPNVRNFTLDPPTARKVAAVIAEPLSPTEAMVKLKDLGLPIDFRPKQLMFLNNPPLRRLALRVE